MNVEGKKNGEKFCMDLCVQNVAKKKKSKTILIPTTVSAYSLSSL